MNAARLNEEMMKKEDLLGQKFDTIKDMTGQKVGKLLVIKKVARPLTRSPKCREAFWLCLCECGNELTVNGASLRNGHTTSCGCARIDGAIKTAKLMLSEDPRITSAKNVFGGYNDGILTFEQFLELSQLPCHYCKASPNNSNIYNRYKHRKNTVLDNISSGDFYYNGLDRLDNSRGHDFDNVVPCCKWCNSAKLNRTHEQFVEWVEKIYNTMFGSG